MPLKNTHARTRRIIVGVFLLCGGLYVGSYGQDSSVTQTPVDTTVTPPEMSTGSTDSVSNAASETTPVVESAPPVVQETVATETVSAEETETKEENVLELDKDVVVGYGTIKKEDLTGSVATVDADALARDAVYSVRKALQGKVPGVFVVQNSGQPGKAVTVRIRGIGTINESSPLYVVDGAPVSSIDYLNPNDIESMSILKDASASAIYGSRGANGVVMVTTKKAKVGERVVTYDMFMGTAQPWKEPDMCNATDWATLKLEAIDQANKYQTDPSKKDTVPAALKNPSDLGEGTNWFEEITRKNAIIHSQNVSVSQGTENLKYYLSGGLFNEQGIIKNTGLEKVMLRLNVENKMTDWWTIGNNFGLTSTDIDYANEQDEHNSVLIYALSMDPATKVRDGNGDLIGSPYNNIKNPVGRMEYYDYREKNTVFNGSFFSDLNLFNVVKFKTTFNLDMQLKDSTQTIAKYNIASDDQQSDAFVSRRMGVDNTWTLENTFTYEKMIDDHFLKMILGSTAQDRTWDSVLAENSTTPGNEATMMYLNSTTSTSPRVQGTAGGNSLASFFGRMEYKFADKYLLTITDRLDASSRFGKGNQWANFPSFAAAWKVSNESFMEKANFIEGLKLRVGWGQMGNDQIGDYLFLTTVTGGQNYPFGDNVLPGTAPLSQGSPDIKWEVSTQTNVGLDMNIIGGRIELNADYFIRRTDDMLVSPQIPTMTGIRNSPIVNGGSMENKGVEVALNYKETIGQFLSNIGLNFSSYKNEVLSLGNNAAPIMDANVRNAGNVTRTEVGKEIAYFYGLKTDGLFQTQADVDNHKTNGKVLQPTAKPGDIKYLDEDGDGELDKGFIGSPHPDFTGGLNIDLSFRGFDFGMGFFGVYGNEIFNGARWYTDHFSGQYGLSSRMLDRWTGPGSTNDANTPRMNQADDNNILLSDRYVEDGSYLRLKTLQFGYSFDSEILKKVYVKKCRIYFGAENLLTITGYSGLDPEIGTFNRDGFTNNPSLSLGVDRGTYPQSRKYMAGLNLTL